MIAPRTSLALALLLAAHPPALAAQGGAGSMAGMDMGGMQMPGMMMTPLNIPMDRMGSGTTWIPDAVPIPSFHKMTGNWDITGHGVGFVQYNSQRGPRGDTQFGSLSWAMLMASRSFAGGMLQLRTMLSLDALGVTRKGYPLLLQTGEAFDGEPLHDIQHPHDFWMELGALYLRPLGTNTGLQLYVAPSGEPALGPVAFMHRPSAFDEPFAPISHHWQDATHITFGVATVGVFSRKWKLEASLFNGREPDDHRWDFDLGALDSRSARLTYNPSTHWSATAGYGRIVEDAEALDRVVFSLLHGTHLGTSGHMSTSLVFGANKHDGGDWSRSLLLESTAALDDRNTFFARMERVRKSAEELGIETGEAPVASVQFDVTSASLGYIRDAGRAAGLKFGVGVRGGVSFVQEQLEDEYGTRLPRSVAIFLRIRPR